MEADRCALHVVRSRAGDGPLLEMIASVGFRLAEPLDAPRPALSDSPTGWVARQGRPLTVAELDTDSRFFRGYERPLRGAVASYLGVPLRYGREIIGVLEVYAREPRQWDADAVRTLLTFASQAAVAFQNARLANESERAARIARLYERLLMMLRQTDAPRAEEVVAALALGLNAPVATLSRDSANDWLPGPSSVPLDAPTLDALRTAIVKEASNIIPSSSPHHPASDGRPHDLITRFPSRCRPAQRGTTGRRRRPIPARRAHPDRPPVRNRRRPAPASVRQQVRGALTGHEQASDRNDRKRSLRVQNSGCPFSTHAHCSRPAIEDLPGAVPGFHWAYRIPTNTPRPELALFAKRTLNQNNSLIFEAGSILSKIGVKNYRIEMLRAQSHNVSQNGNVWVLLMLVIDIG